MCFDSYIDISCVLGLAYYVVHISVSLTIDYPACNCDGDLVRALRDQGHNI